MSISITTVSFSDVLGPRAWTTAAEPDGAGLDEGLDAMLAGLLGPSGFMTAASSPILGRILVPQVPTPVTTCDFPDRTAARRGRKRSRDCCPVCLEVAGCVSSLTTLPCGHSLHRLCAFALLTAPVLGARSMLRCPLCRHPIDRHDAAAMGCDVSPRHLGKAASRCDSLRRLVSGGNTWATGGALTQPPSSLVARLVLNCEGTDATDGFVYNIAVLALERALFHRRTFSQSLDSQLRAPRNASFDPLEFVATSLACHVEVLMRTAFAGDQGVV